MVYDLTMLKAFYSLYEGKIGRIRTVLQRPLTLAEKILYAHLYDERNVKNYKRGEDYVNFRPDRVAMQDATAQMALLQFMNSGRNEAAVPSTVHCDHLIQAYKGAKEDIATATKTNEEVYRFLRDVSSRYGIGFWQPGAGIIHQVVLENYAFPGGMMIGTDSHTPNAGGLGMVAIGVGGADAVDVMTGMEWELKMPRLIGVRLTGALSGWAAPKDVILKLAGILTVKGGTNAVIEYFGPGTASLSATGKATICNMGAEVGATTSLFPYDERMATYLKATGREEVADMATAVAAELRADDEVMANPQKYYDRIIDIDLSALEPYINGPFTPDAATPISEFSEKVLKNGYPRKMEVGLIGSCTNSSYQDMMRVARILKGKRVHPNVSLVIGPGSRQVLTMLARNGALADMMAAGARILETACGPCIGMGQSPNSAGVSLRTFNRNFEGRSGTRDAGVYLVSPETAAVSCLTGYITDPTSVPAAAPVAMPEAFPINDNMVDLPASEDEYESVEVLRGPNIKPLPVAQPLTDTMELPCLLKVGDNITTDHIMPAGSKILPYRSNIPHLANYCFEVCDPEFPARAMAAEGGFIVGGANYGQGSSREHAALVPLYLGIRAVVAKSFARIHRDNLINNGILPLTFANEGDYDDISPMDELTLPHVREAIAQGQEQLTLHNATKGRDYTVCLPLTQRQRGMILAGGLLNYTRESQEK